MTLLATEPGDQSEYYFFLEAQAGKVFRRDPGECFGKLLPSSGSGNRQQDNCQGNGKVSL